MPHTGGILSSVQSSRQNGPVSFDIPNGFWWGGIRWKAEKEIFSANLVLFSADKYSENCGKFKIGDVQTIRVTSIICDEYWVRPDSSEGVS